jgi:predicted dehydrogenase
MSSTTQKRSSLHEPDIGVCRSCQVPTIALIGCGAIAERYHLPALASDRDVITQLILVDRDQDRARALADRFGVSRWAADYREFLPQIDGAIVAVPPALHHRITMDLVSHGIHVLCEKPLAETPHEARQMVHEAKANGVTLSVNHTRRLFPAYAKIRELLVEEALGELVSLTYYDGTEFDWPAASAFHFRSGSRGVMLDTGIHGLDTICWWLGGKPALVSAETDSFGGPESVAHVRLRHGACDIELKLSWLSRLANHYEIIGRRGRIHGDVGDWRRVTIEYADGRRKRIPVQCTAQNYSDFGQAMIGNFVDVVMGRAEPLVPGHDVIAPLELMNECYQAATRFRLPWFETRGIACHV